MTHDEFIQIIISIRSNKNASILEKNISAIASYSMGLAKSIIELAINNPNLYRAFINNDDASTLNIFRADGSAYLYENPKQEVENQIAEFEKTYYLYPSLFLYGISNGVLLKSLLKKQNYKTIILFEPEIEILYIVLNFIDFSKDLTKNRLIIANTKYYNQTQFFLTARLDSVFKSARIYNLYVTSQFYNTYENDILLINKNFLQAFNTILNNTGNDATDSLTALNNSTKHIPYVLDGIPLSSILKERAGKVNSAIIVSTGPSLTKQLPLLKQLQGHVTIISADSSYPILKKNGIKPDYVVSIERVEYTSIFFENPTDEFDKDIIFVVAALTHDKTMDFIKNRNYSLIFKSDFEGIFDDNDFGYLGYGSSCAHLGHDLAFSLKHKKIILIGQDLAFASDGITTHPSDHKYGSVSENVQNSKDRSMVTAYGGVGEVKTYTIWKLFKDQFEVAIQGQKNKVDIYNCTEGGVRIEGTIEKSFKEMVDILLKEQKPLFEIPIKLSKNVKEKKIIKYSKNINKALEYGINLQQDCEMLFNELAKEIENIKLLQEKNKDKEYDYSKLEKILKGIETIKSRFNDSIFKKCYYDILRGMIVNEELEFVKIQTRPTHTEEEKHKKLFELISAHGTWLFKLTGFISVANENIIKSSKEWLVKQ